jgi:hypothetical protein
MEKEKLHAVLKEAIPYRAASQICTRELENFLSR